LIKSADRNDKLLLSQKVKTGYEISPKKGTPQVMGKRVSTSIVNRRLNMVEMGA